MKQYFDSANIAESYSGIVLPLTSSFAKMVYSRVYRDLLKKSGISDKKVESYRHIFDGLLAFFYGRMYYNMNNWYLMAAFAPGYKANKKNFERMITSNIKEEIVTSIKPSLLYRLIYPEILTYKIITYGYNAKRFKLTVRKKMKALNELDFATLSYKECIQLFDRINKDFLNKWYVAVENDFFVMTYLGILSKLLTEQEFQKVLTFKSKATEQVQEIIQLSSEMGKVKLLWNAILKNNEKEFWKQLSLNPKIKRMYKNYSVTFGGRFANELKLESIGADEDITKLFDTLKMYRNFKIEHSVQREIGITSRKKMLVQLILGQFKKYASQREEFRLLRSNTYGLTRKLFRRMGQILVEKNLISSIDDVFYLELNELLSDSILQNKKLKDIILKRKKIYEEYKKITPPSHFETENNKLPKLTERKTIKTKIIQARPASPGIIRGKVRVFKDFYMPDKIDFDILVTSHTDPGWTSLMGLSKGMIIEHGGILSHASIVARELKIPAVIGAIDAVSFLQNGQIVEIDGSTGVIKIL